MLSDCWQRIPPSARTLILAPHAGFKGIFLVNEKEDGDDGPCGSSWGALFHTKERRIYLNVAWDLQTSSRKRWMRRAYDYMQIILVHELAHMFLVSLGDLARSGAERFLRQERQETSDKKEKLSPKEKALLAATQVGSGPGLPSLDEGKTTYVSDTYERYVDAITIAWGFAFEYASAIPVATKDRVPTSKSLRHDKRSYLNSDILYMRELLNNFRGENS
jgi:hypothetical protein